MYICIYIILDVYISLSLPLSLPPSLARSLARSLSLSLPLSLPLSLSLFLSIYITLSLSLYTLNLYTSISGPLTILTHFNKNYSIVNSQPADLLATLWCGNQWRAAPPSGWHFVVPECHLPLSLKALYLRDQPKSSWVNVQ